MSFSNKQQNPLEGIWKVLFIKEIVTFKDETDCKEPSSNETYQEKLQIFFPFASLFPS